MSKLLYSKPLKHTTNVGKAIELQLSYQLFGEPIGTAPVVMVNHALTGNSLVTGKNGWWQDLIGDKKPIDTNKYTIIAFNIPGNGFDDVLIDNYQDFVAKDIASLFLKGLEQIGIKQLFAIIGGSLGGGIAWEMSAIKNDIAIHLIPIASDWKSTDWLIANCRIQEQFLLNSSKPVHDARMHAMMCYRSPESYKAKFNRSVNKKLGVFNIESWLLHHGEKLQERFQLSSYKMMNHLLRTIEVTSDENWIDELNKIKANIHIVAVDSDLFFTAKENKDTYFEMLKSNSNVFYHEIISIHGHDAFLIEFDQLEKIIKPIFNRTKIVEKL